MTALVDETRLERDELLRRCDDEEIRAAVSHVMATPQGRLVLRLITRDLQFAGLEASSFVPGQADSTAFAEGRRAVGRAIDDFLKATCPRLYVEMEAERLNRVIEELRRQEADANHQEPDDAH